MPGLLAQLHAIEKGEGDAMKPYTAPKVTEAAARKVSKVPMGKKMTLKNMAAACKG